MRFLICLLIFSSFNWLALKNTLAQSTLIGSPANNLIYISDNQDIYLEELPVQSSGFTGDPHNDSDYDMSEQSLINEQYLGQHPKFCHAVVYDQEGKLMFFIIDNNIYNRYGYCFRNGNNPIFLHNGNIENEFLTSNHNDDEYYYENEYYQSYALNSIGPLINRFNLHNPDQFADVDINFRIILETNVLIIPTPNSNNTFYIIYGLRKLAQGHSEHMNNSIFIRELSFTDNADGGTIIMSDPLSLIAPLTEDPDPDPVACNHLLFGCNDICMEGNKIYLEISEYRPDYNNYMLFISYNDKLIVKEIGEIVDSDDLVQSNYRYFTISPRETDRGYNRSEMAISKSAISNSYNICIPDRENTSDGDYHPFTYSFLNIPDQIDNIYNTQDFFHDPNSERIVYVDNSDNAPEKMAKGLEFSPNGQYIYFNFTEQENFYYMETSFLEDSEIEPVLNSLKFNNIDVSDFENSQLVMGWDNNLYLAGQNNKLARITNPDNPINGASFEILNMFNENNYYSHEDPDLEQIIPSLGFSDYKFFQFSNQSFGKTSQSYYETLNLTCEEYASMLVYDNISEEEISNIEDENILWEPGNNHFRNTHKTLCFSQDLVIPFDKTVEIRNMKIRFAPGAGIQVNRSYGNNPGGKLILTNCELTSTSDEDWCFWKGIEVRGHKDLGQTIETVQGRLVMNNCTIKNAETAIFVGKPSKDRYENGFSGGIIDVTGTDFVNCATAIEYTPYQNISSSGFELINKGIIKKCNFLYNNEFADTETSIGPVIILDDVKGIHLIANVFENRTSVPGYVNQGRAIVAYNSSFIMKAHCVSPPPPGEPCPEEDLVYNEIKSFTEGICAENSFRDKSIIVEHTNFSNLQSAINISNMHNAELVQNNFDIKYIDAGRPCYGIYLNHCSGYHIEANHFTSSGFSGISAGIYINHSGEDDNEIYRNHFSNLDYGCRADGVNANQAGRIGLQFLCNEFSAIAQYSIYSTRDGINMYQGYHDFPADNIFNTAGSGNYDLYNDGLHYTYFYTSGNNKRPRFDNHASKIGLVWTTDDNDCPSKLREGGVIPIEDGLGKMAEADSRANDLKTIISQVEDNGNTNALNLEVLTAQGYEAYEINNLLLGISPYVSETVLSTSIEEEDLLPPVMLKNVLKANPKSAKSDQLQNKLNNRINPLPDFMLEEINENKNHISGHEILRSRLQQLKSEKQDIKRRNLIAINALNDENYEEEAISYLEYDNSFKDKLLMYTYFLQKQELTLAEQLLDEMQDEINTDESLDENMQQILPFLFEYETTNRDTQILFDDQRVLLYQLAQNSSSLSGMHAINVLIHHEGYEYDEPLNFPDNNGDKSGQLDNNIAENVMNTVNTQFVIHPNPANDYFIIEYDLNSQDFNRAFIEISSTDGKKIEMIRLNQPENHILLNTKKYNSGVYFVKITLDGFVLYHQKLIIVK